MDQNLNQLSDKKLLVLMADSNELAFSSLFERHWEKLLDTAFKVTGDKEASQDIVQDVFAEVWNKREDLAIDNVEAYLHQSTRYAVFRHIRRARLIVTDLSSVEAPLHINTTEEQVSFDEISNRLEQSIEQLPEQRQRVFKLSRYEHLTNKEIASRLDISVRTVENHISKALETLRYQYTDVLWVLFILSFY